VAETPHILVVEDQPETAEMLTSYFQTQGYEVTSVGWGKDALAFAKKTVPDLIVLDIRLPDIDGYEVCKRLRGHRRTAQVPVIFLTERRERSDRLRGLKLGAVDYITKPFDIQELRLRVRNVLRRSDVDQMSHFVTGLPGSSLSDERLRELLESSGWALFSVGLQGLDAFSDAYGFVARDDVMRAVALMLNHVVDESQDPNAFVGHLDDVSFFVIITPDKAEWVQKELAARLDEAMAFFYPRADWESGKKDESTKLPRLEVTMGILTSSAGPFGNLADLKKASAKVQRQA
jgi:PleD family two-component response regulator